MNAQEMDRAKDLMEGNGSRYRGTADEADDSKQELTVDEINDADADADADADSDADADADDADADEYPGSVN